MQRKIRSIYLVIIDVILINLSFFLALLLRFDFKLPQQYIDIYMKNLITYILIKIAVFAYFKLYNSLWKYASVEELLQVIVASITSNALLISYMIILDIRFPKSIYILVTIIDTILIGGFRLSYRIFRRMKTGNLMINKSEKRVMIIGAGDAGAMVIKELNNHTQLDSKPVAIIDDDIKKEGTRINGVPVVGQRFDIYSVSIKKSVDEIIIAMPSASKKDIKEIVEECKKTKCKVKILPGMYELIDGKVNISQLRDVQIEDLLGREQIKLHTEEISDYLNDKKILVTGGGGSIGSELCRQIAKYNPRELIILDIYENNAYDLQNELNRKFNRDVHNKKLNLKVLIASVRDKMRIEEIIRENRPDVIFHAAAHKHVPLMENNPKAAIKNNIFGTLNVAQAADKYGVNRFVLISTDKAVNPTNIMGASKRVCEMIIQSINKVSKTEFVAVRFGNVLGSNGSVIPLFKKQIAEGGPVTVTHEDIIRYFMTIPEAAQLVIQAGAMAEGGEIFILDMGEPVRILNLAEDLIRLSGFEPYEDIPIEITGLRSGEKLFEELLLDAEGLASTKHEKIFIGKPIFTDYNLLIRDIERLNDIVKMGNFNEIKNVLMEVVPTYNDPEYINSIHTKLHKNEEIATAQA